jgi:hypothetical protein
MEAHTHSDVGADEEQVAVAGGQSEGQVDEEMEGEYDTDSDPGASEEQVSVEGELSEGQVDEDMEGEYDTDSDPSASEDRVSVEGEQDMEGEPDNDEVQEQAVHEVYMNQQEGQQDRHVEEPGLRSGQMTVEPDVWMEDGTLGWGNVSVYNSSLEMILC